MSASTPPEYAELYCRSAFSFLTAAARPEQLIKRAAELGLYALAIADCNDVGGAVRAATTAQACTPDFHTIHGATLTLENENSLPLLVRTQKGWSNLCRLITEARMNHERGYPQTSLQTLATYSDGLLALIGAERCPLRQAISEENNSRSNVILGTLHDIFGDHLAIQLSRHGLAREERLNRELIAYAARHCIPWVPTNDVRYLHPEDRRVLDVMTCLKHHVSLDEAGPWVLPNHHWHLKSPAQMARLWHGHEEALSRTIALADQCQFSVLHLNPALPNYQGFNDVKLLTQKVWKGARIRYGQSLGEKQRQQLTYELQVITSLKLMGYFLIVADIVDYARSRDIMVQGRGSAANSAVCYCLGITAIDPIGMELLFERFLSEGRSDPPDIDLDIAHMDREEVLQYVYRRYGQHHAAMVSENITWRGKSAIRDVARVLNLDSQTAAALSVQVGRAEAADAADILACGGIEKAGFDPNDTRFHVLIDVVRRMDRLPRHRSIHVGGFVLTAARLDSVVPVEHASMPGRTIIQWDKDDLGPVGLIKIDLLGLGMLTLIHKAIESIRIGRHIHVDLAHLPMDDPAVYDMIAQADTVGLFQVESRAQMNTLPRLRPRTFYDLVVQIAIIRPGPIQGQMVHPYIRRRRGEEAVTYLHPDLEPVLKRTLGIPLFQEQGMKVAIAMAGFSPSQADRLRKIMGFKRATEHLEGLTRDLWDGMMARGVSEDVAFQILKQLEGFASYGFPESHSASFALLTYASAWLKHHFAPEFTAAILNAQPMGFYSPATLISDAQRHGVVIRPIDLLYSRWECTLEYDVHPPALRVGLRLVRGLSTQARKKLETVTMNASLSTLDGLVFHSQVDDHTLTILARAGAFRSMWPGRRDALWNLLARLKERHASLPLRNGEEPNPRLPSMTLLEEVTADYTFVGMSHQKHPMAFYRHSLNQADVMTSNALLSVPTDHSIRIAGTIICRQRPGSAKGVLFMTVEDEFGMVNVAVMPHVFEANRVILTTASALMIEGKLERDQNAISVLGRRFSPLPELPLNVHLRPRNFH